MKRTALDKSNVLQAKVLQKNGSSQCQAGLTLVEIMVAITISLLLLMGVSQILLASKQSYKLQDGLSRLQENARFALDIMARNISMAGYTTTPGSLSAFDFSRGFILDNSSTNADLGFTVGNLKASDEIEISYQSPTDCLGNATPGGIAIDRYYIKTDTSDLMCLGNGGGGEELLAEGIENMQILYGEDTDADGIANRFVNATNVADWGAIESVRIAILAGTVENVGGLDSATYVLLNAPALGPFQDPFLRRVFTRTILLRNTS